MRGCVFAASHLLPPWLWARWPSGSPRKSLESRWRKRSHSPSFQLLVASPSARGGCGLQQPLAALVQSAAVDCHYRLQNSFAIRAALISTAATVSVRISRKSAYVIPPLPCVPDGFPGVAQTLKNLPAMCETWVQYLGQEDPLEKGMATHSSILAWRIPWKRSMVGYCPRGRKESNMTD